MSGKKKPARNKRKTDKHKQNYGITAKEWAKFKKENPADAHVLRMKVEQRLATKSKTAKQ